MDYRTPAVPIDGLVKVFHSLEERSGWNVLAMPNGLRLRQRFDPWQLIAAVIIAGICALVAMALLTVDGPWAFIGMIACWIVFAFCVLGGLLSLRRPSLVIDAAARTLRGDDLYGGALDASFGDVSEIELVRRPRERSTGSAKLSFHIGKSEHSILDLDEIGYINMSRAKAVALGFAALFGVPCVERSTDAAIAALASFDRSAGLPAADAHDPSTLEEARELGAKAAGHASTAAEAAIAFIKVLDGL